MENAARYLKLSNPETADKLYAEYERLRKRLYTYEGPDEKSSAEEEKRKIRKIFDIFDLDRSGDLDAKEFQELAFLLGETLTLEEVEERIKIIDQDDNGRIDFKEFYDWWISPDHDFLKSSRRTDDLKLLKATLRSRALMRTITRLNEKVANEWEAREANQEAPPLDDISRIHISVNAGKIDSPACSVRIAFEDSAEPAEQLRRELEAKDETSIVISLSFNVKEGVSDFEVGEISGSLKTLLAMAKKESYLANFQIKLLRGNQRVLRLLLLVEKEQLSMFDEIYKFASAIHPRFFSAHLELSHSPRDSLKEELGIHFVAKGEMHKTSLEMLKELLAEDEAAQKLWIWHRSDSGTLGPSKSRTLSLHLLSLLHTLHVDLHLDSFQELLQQWWRDFPTDSPNTPSSPRGWSALTSLIIPPIVRQVIDAEDASGPAWLVADVCQRAARLFDGFPNARWQIGNLAIKMTSEGFDPFALFPSPVELEEAKRMEREMKRELKHSKKKITPGSLSNASIASFESEGDLGSSSESALGEPGIIYHMLLHDEVPQVFSSSLLRGTVEDFIERDNTFCWSANKPFSWFCVDIGKGKRVLARRYRMRYGSTGSFCCPRNWRLEAAARLTHKIDDPASPDWVTLKDHVDDKTLNAPFATGYWDLPPSETGHRYFRVTQTGPNCYQCPPDTEDTWSNVFVASGFEIYGDIWETADDNPEEAPLALGNKTFHVLHDNDTNGIVYYLRSQGVRLHVSSSSIARGQPRDFIKRGEIFCWTQNRPFSWFMVDFGSGRRITPTYYAFRYGSGGSACCPRNWLLQGATLLFDQTFNPDSPDWTTLSTHKNDQTFREPHAIASFPIDDCQESFRYFRIIQTGPNCFTGGSGWKDVLVASGFEIYGTLHSDETSDKSVGSDWSGFDSDDESD